MKGSAGAARSGPLLQPGIHGVVDVRMVEQIEVVRVPDVVTMIRFEWDVAVPRVATGGAGRGHEEVAENFVPAGGAGRW